MTDSGPISRSRPADQAATRLGGSRFDRGQGEWASKPCIICRKQGGCGMCELFEILNDDDPEARRDWEKY